MSKIGITHEFEMGDGKKISIETGKIAKQADGSVVVKMGDTMLLATVVSSKDAKEGTDFLPLSVDYQEKYASTGRIPGGFLKRESRLSDYEVLICRLVDRALRPMFPEDYHSDVQVMISLISADKNIMPDALAAFAASAAISISNIPFNGPISEVRVARIDGQFQINPTISDIARADMDMIVAGNAKDICMVEGEMKEVSEAEMAEAIRVAHEAIKLQVQAQVDFIAKVGYKEKRTYKHEPEARPELMDKIRAFAYDRVYAVAKSALGKDERSLAFRAIRDDFEATVSEEMTESAFAWLMKKYYHDIEKEAIRNLVLNEGVRLDGRGTKNIRPIWSEVGYLPSAHGSAIFTRGETQSLTTVTLGAKTDEQMIDGAMFFGYNKFLLHYNFPGFSTGEVRPNRGAGRREIGHGNLAMRSLKQVLPGDDENPYVIRIVSDILESNGSSSMATVCAGTLALMDAGVKIKAPVSGIAMGLITDPKTGKYAVLSDILGDEDHLGDMDFKVTGTTKGITACQMDLKIDGLSYDTLAEALLQAKEGRAHILNEMMSTLETPREDYKPHAPRIVEIRVAKEFIGAIIGPGGKIIQEMQRESGATISIEEKDNQGIVQIYADNKEAIEKVTAKIKGMTTIPEVGEVYEGKVKSIMPFGAFVEILPGKDGLLHISEIDWKRYETMDGVLEVGEVVKVKLIDVDKKTGKLKLSRKVLIPRPEKTNDAPSAEL
ncbi:MAG: polyribonucleotide nucleotidyltransferase [Sphingobacteriales bacterium]|jgi:polyribonucleotide nucleotidyltransferase|nr:polyribonucleotide nucleotidyltransferase [Sphingobacteriales bacterium]